MTAGLEVDVTAHRGAFALTAALVVPDGEVLAVLGPNGSGKSTLLDVIAGALAPSRGHVRWRGRELSRAGARPLPPHRRRIGLLRQDPLLFPHLTVAENVAFGPRAGGDRDAVTRGREWLDRLGAADLADRHPRQLSGGQAARVALARTLAARPEVLLLDEPLAALDAAAAPQLRAILGDVVRETGLTTVLVSHAVLDAALLADRVAVLHDGAVVEHGPRAEVLGAPRTTFTAAFVGVNLVPTGFAGLVPRAADDPPDGGGQLRFRPSAVEISPVRDERENSWEATVRWLEPVTGGVRARLALAGRDEAPDVLADVDPAVVDGDWLGAGARVWLHVDPRAITLV